MPRQTQLLPRIIEVVQTESLKRHRLSPLHPSPHLNVVFNQTQTHAREHNPLAK